GSGSRAAGSPIRRAVCWRGEAYGEYLATNDGRDVAMTSAGPLLRSGPSSAPAERAITILGATGSIGASTIDLINRNRERFRVEAVTAARNAQALAKLARELGARFAAIADEGCYAELKSALTGS